MKRFAIPFVAAVSLTFAVAWTMAFRQVRRPTLPPSPPPSAVAPQTVAGIGLVEPESENIALSCSVSGMVTGVYVKAGDRVQAHAARGRTAPKRNQVFRRLPTPRPGRTRLQHLRGVGQFLRRRVRQARLQEHT